MKLRNKKTGEIKDVESIGHAGSLKGKFGYQVTLSWKMDEHLDTCKTYNSLAELNEEWEDYEEPKEYWFLSGRGTIRHIEDDDTEFDKDHKRIGNYFETEEEAEKAAERLRAWKRLKDKGFRFGGHDDRDRGQLGDIVIYSEMPTFEYDDDSTRDDLNLLFSGEED